MKKPRAEGELMFFDPTALLLVRSMDDFSRLRG
jgi:hypothetical protein